MALTDQPYLPLYIRDWLSNLKLKTCNANSHGIMINTMCLMHLSETYGKILLNQKYKQTDKQVTNFALQLAKFLPFELVEVENGLTELLNEKALVIDGDLLICKRMVKDAEISNKRAISGKEGGEKSYKKRAEFAQAKVKPKRKAKSQANTVIVIENEIENEIIEKGGMGGKINKPKKTRTEFSPPELIEVEKFFSEKGYPKSLANKFFDSYSVADWIDSKGNPVKNWKQKAINVWFKEENKSNGTKGIKSINQQNDESEREKFIIEHAAGLHPRIDADVSIL